MKYFISKVVATPDVTLSFVAPMQPEGPAMIHYIYGRVGDQEIHGIDYPEGEINSQAVLLIQHPECEVREVQFSEVEEDLKNCRFSQEINQDVVSSIRSRYSIDEELKIMKQDPASDEYLSMIEWINTCRTVGNEKKVELGVRQ